MQFLMPFRLWIVATDRANPNHHGLHDNTAPHVLTLDPAPGDRIVARLAGQKTCELQGENGGYRVVRAYLMTHRERLSTHPGRSALLGEDTLDGAYGHDALDALVSELLDGASWNYAPVIYSADDTKTRTHVWERDSSGAWHKVR